MSSKEKLSVRSVGLEYTSKVVFVPDGGADNTGKVVEYVIVRGAHPEIPNSMIVHKGAEVTTVASTVYDYKYPAKAKSDGEKTYLDICAWCTLGVEPPKPDEFEEIRSHGICTGHQQELIEQNNDRIRHKHVA